MLPIIIKSRCSASTKCNRNSIATENATSEKNWQNPANPILRHFPKAKTKSKKSWIFTFRLRFSKPQSTTISPSETWLSHTKQVTHSSFWDTFSGHPFFSWTYQTFGRFPRTSLSSWGSRRTKLGSGCPLLSFCLTTWLYKTTLGQKTKRISATIPIAGFGIKSTFQLNNHYCPIKLKYNYQVAPLEL